MISFNKETRKEAKRHREVCGIRERAKQHRAYQRRTTLAKWRMQIEEIRRGIRRRRADRKQQAAVKRLRETDAS